MSWAIKIIVFFGLRANLLRIVTIDIDNWFYETGPSFDRLSWPTWALKKIYLKWSFCRATLVLLRIAFGHWMNLNVVYLILKRNLQIPLKKNNLTLILESDHSKCFKRKMMEVCVCVCVCLCCVFVRACARVSWIDYMQSIL